MCLSIISANLMAETFSFTCEPRMGDINNSFSTTGTIDKDTMKGVLKNLQLDDGMGNIKSFESLDVRVIYDDYDMRLLRLITDKQEFQFITINLFKSASDVTYNKGMQDGYYSYWSFCTKN